MTKIAKIISFEFHMKKRKKMRQKQMFVSATFVKE